MRTREGPDRQGTGGRSSSGPSVASEDGDGGNTSGSMYREDGSSRGRCVEERARVHGQCERARPEDAAEQALTSRRRSVRRRTRAPSLHQVFVQPRHADLPSLWRPLSSATCLIGFHRLVGRRAGDCEGCGPYFLQAENPCPAPVVALGRWLPLQRPDRCGPCGPCGPSSERTFCCRAPKKGWPGVGSVVCDWGVAARQTRQETRFANESAW